MKGSSRNPIKSQLLFHPLCIKYLISTYLYNAIVHVSGGLKVSRDMKDKMKNFSIERKGKELSKVNQKRIESLDVEGAFN